MNTLLGILSKGGDKLIITEKATMDKPTIKDNKYWTNNATTPDFELLKVANELYAEHIASLRSFEAIGFSEDMVSKEVSYILEKQTQIEINVDMGCGWEKASDMEYEQETEFFRRIVAVPAPASAPTGKPEGERFKMPEDSEIVKAAIVFNDGLMDQKILTNMVGLVDFVLARLYENGDIKIPSSKE